MSGCLQRVLGDRCGWSKEGKQGQWPSVTLGTLVPQISLPGHASASDLSESTSLGIQLFCILLMNNLAENCLIVFGQNFLIMFGLKPFTYMKQNWS